MISERDTPSRRTMRARTARVSDEEILAFAEQGLSLGEMSRAFAEQGVTISRQALSQRMARLREAEQDKAERLLPWTVRVEHSKGWLYTAATSYAKWRRGEKPRQRDLSAARALEEKLTNLGAVLTYDRERGFVLRNRRPGDGPSILAEK